MKTRKKSQIVKKKKTIKKISDDVFINNILPQLSKNDITALKKTSKSMSEKTIMKLKGLHILNYISNQLSLIHSNTEMETIIKTNYIFRPMITFTFRNGNYDNMNDDYKFYILPSINGYPNYYVYLMDMSSLTKKISNTNKFTNNEIGDLVTKLFDGMEINQVDRQFTPLQKIFTVIENARKYIENKYKTNKQIKDIGFTYSDTDFDILYEEAQNTYGFVEDNEDYFDYYE